MDSRKLHQKLIEATNIIDKKSRTGSGNYVVTSNAFLDIWIKTEKKSKRISFIKNILEI